MELVLPEGFSLGAGGQQGGEARPELRHKPRGPGAGSDLQ